MHICSLANPFFYPVYAPFPPWTWTKMRGLPEGGEGGWLDVGKGRKNRDNCNGIDIKIQ